jgi:type III secretory pathway component EscV
VVLTAPDIRPHVRRLLGTQHPRLAVLSYRELAPDTRLERLGPITV